ncbi:MAG: response regulator transcription factor [Lachnospiraceae bacterium]|nr:response regulator transcription factor [Lachnospiraceae bacterium]
MFPINILLVDDHELFAKSLSIALDECREIKNFYIAQNIRSLQNILREKEVDIILMDINLGRMSDADGLETAARLLQKDPALKIIILTGYDLPVYRHEAKKLGIRGFLNKNIAPDDLIASLTRVFQGGYCFSPEADNGFIEELTDMEKKVLQLVSTGQSRKETADALHISERTLSNHLQHIFEKLDVSSTIQAVTKAIRLGYIPPIC